MKTFVRRWSCFIILELLCKTVWGNYELEVTLQAYSNPTNQFRASNGLICCDFRDSLSDDDNCTEAERCDDYFTFCLRELGATSHTASDCLTPITVSFINTDAAPIDFSAPTILGLPNPLTIAFDPTNGFTGIQLFVRVDDSEDQDAGSFNTDDLVDVFMFNIPPEAIDGIGRDMFLNGALGLATLSLSTRLHCSDFDTGDQCELIDYCRQSSITCSGNGRCVNTNTTFTCECGPMYTGMLCELSLGVPVVEIAAGVAGGVLLLLVIALTLICAICIVQRSRTKQGKAQIVADTKLTTNDAYNRPQVDTRDIVLSENVGYSSAGSGDREYDYPEVPAACSDNPLYASIDDSIDTIGR